MLREARDITFRPALVSVHTLCAALALGAIAVPMRAQSPQPQRPNLQGVWVSQNTALEDPRWTIEDRVCARCALPAQDRLRAILGDKHSGQRSLKDIMAEVNGFNRQYIAGLLTHAAASVQAAYDVADDPVLACKPVGLFTQADGVLPMQIEQYADRVVFRYEYFGAVRTVYTDGRWHPNDVKPSRLGHSIGWYDGETLVVDTVAIEPNPVGDFIVRGIRTSGRARGIERYTRSEDGNTLDREMTIVDPWTFRQPLTFKRSFLYAPSESLQQFDCSVPPEYSQPKRVGTGNTPP